MANGWRYGWPEAHNRHLSWSMMFELASQIYEPQVCFGDFNEILYDTKQGGMNKLNDK